MEHRLAAPGSRILAVMREHPIASLFALSIGLTGVSLGNVDRYAPLAYVGVGSSFFTGMMLLQGGQQNEWGDSRATGGSLTLSRQVPPKTDNPQEPTDSHKDSEPSLADELNWHHKYNVMVARCNELEASVKNWTLLVSQLEDERDGYRMKLMDANRFYQDKYESELVRLEYTNRNLLHAEGQKMSKLKAEVKELVDEYQGKLRDAYTQLNLRQEEIDRLNELLKLKVAALFFDGKCTAEIYGNKLLKAFVQQDILLDALSAKTQPDGRVMVKLKARQPIDPQTIFKTKSHIQALLMLLSEPDIDFAGNVFTFTMETCDTPTLKRIAPSMSTLGTDDGLTLDALSDRQSHTLIFVAGKQGAGKSLVMQYLASTYSHSVAVSPHLRVSGEKQDFLGCHRVGAGADYDAIARYLESTMGKVKERLREYAQGKDEFEPVDIFLDEVPAIQRVFREDKETKELMLRFLGTFMTEPRKVAMRAFVGTQSTTVASMGIPGLATLRDECSWIRLGKTAVQHADTLGLTQVSKELQAQLDRYESAERMDTAPPAMLNDKLLRLPTIRDMVAALEAPKQPSIAELAAKGMTVTEIVETLYGLKPSRSAEYQRAKAEVTAALKTT